MPGMFQQIKAYRIRQNSILPQVMATGDVSLPSGVGGIAELDGGIPIHAAVDDDAQFERFVV